jgi:predicted nucleic acid-binding Zn ribbon protein
MLPSTGMERASRTLAQMRLGAALDSQELAIHAWPAAVGKKIAAHTRAARLTSTTLAVEVGDPVWERQLSALAPQILRNLEKALGPGLVDRIDFYVRAERRAPQRATRSMDEADGIEDPVLRDIYRSARKKALA